MPDVLTPQQRHRCMSHIRSKATKPEMAVRRWLWAHGYRYRLNVKSLPGKPDIVIGRYKVCIFVNGCFWHGHNVTFVTDMEGRTNATDSACCKTPVTHRNFWAAKIQRNIERDMQVRHTLEEMGWHCITVWECSLRPAAREETLRTIKQTIRYFHPTSHHYTAAPGRLPLAAERGAEYCKKR